MDYPDLLVAGTVVLIPIFSFFTLKEKDLLHAIIGRGMIGLSAAIAYALMGAPDVAVTEALMGAFLVTLLYVVVFTSAREFRVGYVELPVLVEEEDGKLVGYLVELLNNFGKSAGFKPGFVFFENRETLMDAVQQGYVDMGIGPFVLPFDSSDEYLTLPVVETRVLKNDKGEWIDLLRARHSSGFEDFTGGTGEVEDGFYSVLLSEEAHDIKDMFFSFMGDKESSGIPELRKKYLGELE